jgi:replicative DNA helicase
VSEVVPPQSLEAEEAILGACLLSSRAVETALEHIDPRDFYKGSHRLILEAIGVLEGRSEPVDVLTVIDILKERGRLEDAGGESKVRELAALMPTISNVKHYCEIVREKAVLRRMIRTGGEIAQLGWNGAGSSRELIAQAEGVFSGLTSRENGTDFKPIWGAVSGLAHEIADAVKTKARPAGTHCGFMDLNTALTGLHGGRLYVVAARPGMGKTVLTQNVCENIASKRAAALISLEMSQSEIAARCLSRATGMATSILTTGVVFTDEQLEKMVAGAEQIKDKQLLIDDDTAVTMSDIRARCRRLARKHDLGLIAVDYLQLMLTETTDDSRANQVAEISRGLKLLARELDVPVIAVSQLNRAVEHRADKRPTLSDLRDSGAIEQDADAVIFIYRDEYYNAQSETPGVAELIIAKNRFGPTNTIRMAFSGASSTFFDLAKGY